MAQLSPRDIDQTLATLREQVASPTSVGDIPALRARVEAAAKAAEERKEIAREERKAAKAQALADRTAVVERAEAIVAQDPAKTHWKQSARPCVTCWKSGRPCSVAARAWKRPWRTSCGSVSPPRAPSSTVTAVSSSRSWIRRSLRPSASRKERTTLKSRRGIIPRLKSVGNQGPPF